MKRSEETVNRIIQAALELFVRNGYHGTSISDITRKVGVTKGALYAHFNSKDEVLIRIIEEFEIRFIDELIRSVSELSGNALAKFHHAISFTSQFAAQNQDLCVFLTFLTTELNADVDFEPALKNVYRKFQDFISQLVRQGMQQGLFKEGLDPDLAGLAFLAVHDGLLHQWVLNRDRVDGEQFVRNFRKIFMHGLVKHTPA
jgi:AcrR family transcriptional regulator